MVAAIALGRRYNARLFINDYWRLAIKHQAYGVHLGQEDLQATDLSAIRAAGLRLGVSTHDDMEIDVALAARPSYIALGHVFPTQTKQMPSAPQGLEQLARHVERLADYPTVAIGGISPGARACGDSNRCRQYRRRQRHYSSRRLAFGNGTAAGNCRSWR
ncbi:thiamine-phosphate pyrophosphorylase [Escherichia coli]|nr:thiamine-phosphate pyrophosphorylase [Escherichia coli]